MPPLGGENQHTAQSQLPPQYINHAQPAFPEYTRQAQTPYQGQNYSQGQNPYQGQNAGQTPPPYQGPNAGQTPPPYQGPNAGQGPNPYQGQYYSQGQNPYQGPNPYQGQNYGQAQNSYQGQNAGQNQNPYLGQMPPRNPYPPNNPYSPRYDGRTSNNGKATASLVLGIISLIAAWFGYGAILAVVLSIIGIILGVGARKELTPEQGRSMATVGMICSIIALVLSTIVFVSCVVCASALSSVGPAYGSSYKM